MTFESVIEFSFYVFSDFSCPVEVPVVPNAVIRMKIRALPFFVRPLQGLPVLTLVAVLEERVKKADREHVDFL